MSRPTAPGVEPAESVRLDVGQVVFAVIHSSVRRARLMADLGLDLVQRRRPPLEAIRAWVDGNEQSLAELSVRWQLAGVRWPHLAILAVGFLAGYSAGRRRR